MSKVIQKVKTIQKNLASDCSPHPLKFLRGGSKREKNMQKDSSTSSREVHASQVKLTVWFA